MEKEINIFKNTNGNVNYSTKELLGAIHTKLDRIEERLSRGDREFGDIIATCKVRGNLLKIFLPIIVSCLGGLLYLILSLHNIV